MPPMSIGKADVRKNSKSCWKQSFRNSRSYPLRFVRTSPSSILGKAKYFLTFTDDKSCKTWIYFLQTKSQTFEFDPLRCTRIAQRGLIKSNRSVHSNLSTKFSKCICFFITCSIPRIFFSIIPNSFTNFISSISLWSILLLWPFNKKFPEYLTSQVHIGLMISIFGQLMMR